MNFGLFDFCFVLVSQELSRVDPEAINDHLIPGVRVPMEPAPLWLVAASLPELT
jgi:hypothetical protein